MQGHNEGRKSRYMLPAEETAVSYLLSSILKAARINSPAISNEWCRVDENIDICPKRKKEKKKNPVKWIGEKED
jgi:hypothetical protein